MGNEEYLKGKSILYIDTKLFGYYKDIIVAMEKAGATVDYIPSGFSNIKETLSGALKLNTKPKNYYYTKILKRFPFQRQYDYVWVKPAESIPIFFLRELRDRFHRAQFISYHWHPIKTKNISFLEEIFDKLYSFDRTDIEKSYRINYLPLFYTDEFNLRHVSRKKYDYDIVFIGNALIDERNEFLSKIAVLCKSENLKYHYHLYSTYKAYIKAFFNRNKMPSVSFKKLARNEIANIFIKSRCVIDFNNPRQTGLTMRTFEALATGAKLITTNITISQESFYSPDYIYIIDKDNPKIDQKFFYKENYSVSNRIENYSIHSWVKAFFDSDSVDI
jgi:hypothetical protein